MKKLFLCFLFLLFAVCNSYSQIKPKYLDATLQFDASTVLFSGQLSGSLDLDVYNFGTDKLRFYTGIRFEYDQ